MQISYYPNSISNSIYFHFIRKLLLTFVYLGFPISWVIYHMLSLQFVNYISHINILRIID